MVGGDRHPDLVPDAKEEKPALRTVNRHLSWSHDDVDDDDDSILRTTIEFDCQISSYSPVGSVRQSIENIAPS